MGDREYERCVRCGAETSDRIEHRDITHGGNHATYQLCPRCGHEQSFTPGSTGYELNELEPYKRSDVLELLTNALGAYRAWLCDGGDLDGKCEPDDVRVVNGRLEVRTPDGSIFDIKISKRQSRR